MKYEVRKNGQTYMSTESERCTYPPRIEASMQAAGYSIYVDGKRKKKITAGSSRRE